MGTPLDETTADCSPAADVYFTLNTDMKNAKEMYSSLLAAYMSGNKIELRIVEGSPNCELAYVKFDVNQ